MRRGFSSAGRAPALQAGGQRFEPANLHQDTLTFNQFKAQRSGFELERRRKGAGVAFAKGGSGAERTLRRRGPIAQLARAHD